MITAMERADWMALQIFIAAREHNGRVITHDLVDAVMSRDADKEQGKANKEMVRRIIRKRAESEGVRVIFTEDERYWAIREQLHRMTTDEVHALRDEITEGGDDDPRGWDPILTKAISIRLSHRQQTRRLWNCTPVSIHLWRMPRPAAVEERPASAEETAPAAPDTATLYAALAAYESTVHASLGGAPRDLANLARHLFTLGKIAAPEHHLEVVESHNAVEEAWEALRTARTLTARNAAHDQARNAVERARAAILAVAPRAHRMHGTDMPGTAEEIRVAALAYNAVDATPEELSAVATGTPTVRVHCRSDSGTGWTVTATITAGLDSPIGHAPAHPPIVLKFRKRDGRVDAAENTRRMFGSRIRVAVPVEYVTDRRP
ncbi:hypothetical protein [Streptomyces sp. MBT33]|uniref:hypothetical protein n=1 Tax=Streptomyces sp. MBT33 TaxID=1488363 RepID=UPI00190AA0CE|nr:hypothetical protein [Streptomyces sp. MBT33]MBK3645032.1 hypothetical protein [Streptomyces sp. MBT33]